MRPPAPSAMSLLSGATMVRETTSPAVVAPPPALLASSKDMEVASMTFDALASSDQRVGLKRQWSSIDVYVSLERAFPAPAAGGTIQVNVFAVSEATGRVLVATGAVFPRPFNSDLFLPLQIAAFRGEPQRFEVDVRTRAPNATGGPKLTITAVGTRNTAAASEKIGALPFVSAAGLINPAVGTAIFSNRELLHFTATQIPPGGGASPARWVLYFETTGVVAAGTRPLAVWRVPVDGTADIRPDVPRVQAGSPALIASSTPDILTAANDVYLTALIR